MGSMAADERSAAVALPSTVHMVRSPPVLPSILS